MVTPEGQVGYYDSQGMITPTVPSPVTPQGGEQLPQILPSPMMMVPPRPQVQPQESFGVEQAPIPQVEEQPVVSPVEDPGLTSLRTEEPAVLPAVQPQVDIKEPIAETAEELQQPPVPKVKNRQ
jgi:hypothetical protein